MEESRDIEKVVLALERMGETPRERLQRSLSAALKDLMWRKE